MSDLWLAAALAMLVPLAIAVAGLMRGTTAARLSALSLASGIAVIMLAMMSYAFDQAAALDIAFALALMTLPGTLMFALFQERWL